MPTLDTLPANLPARVVSALIDTARRTTELDNIYNDLTGDRVSWADAAALLASLQTYPELEKARLRAELEARAAEREAMARRVDDIFRSVLDALQAAEEIAGPTGDCYQLLMHKVAQAALARATQALVVFPNPAR